jgi:hypothetical protein
MLRRVALRRTNVSKEHSASIIKVTRISELGTMLALTSKSCFNKNAFIYKGMWARRIVGLGEG